MAAFLYKLGVQFYGLLLRASAPFHGKARQWVAGREAIFLKIKGQLENNQAPVVWFHCASLGEFEQGRPVMERIKRDYPHLKIALTFFSPSGYEVRKNYDGADYIFYLPLDSASHAQQFISLIKPILAIFVKYEFWYYYLRELHARQIPVISISAIFHENQVFFKPYGTFYRNILKFFTHLFTQDQASADLLLQQGITQVTVAGDTRFDRVLQTAATAKEIPIVQNFKNSEPLMVIGSSWPADMRVLLPFIREKIAEIKFVIAPHEIHPEQITALLNYFPGKAIAYSKAQLEHVAGYRVLVIDNIGMLSSLYRYGNYAYIGGAFGKGLHNTLEAAVFGLPLFFGPVYTKFKEALDLVALQAAFPVQDTAALRAYFKELQTDPGNQRLISENIINYVAEQAGATAIIVAACTPWLPQTT